MATDSGSDTERTAVKTYVPSYQRDEWDDHADELDMSRSEFVRSMVQAGRRGFGASEAGTHPGHGETGVQSNGDAGNDDLEPQVIALLEERPRNWDELLTELTDDIERRLDETLQELQSTGHVRHSGRDGGYVLDE
jgi:hypothetical protein